MQETEQPINWARAFLSGWAAATLMMAFMDIFFLLGITPFSFEAYLGSLLFNSSAGTHIWTLGLFANWILGAVFSVFYAYYFENVFRGSGSRHGAVLGLGHAFVAAIAIFPFFTAIREFMGIQLYSDFGFFGVGLGAPTAILLLFSHLVYGTTLGTFYGPVGRDRVRARFFDAWESLPPGARGTVTEGEDAEDRVAA
jgi:hypothetical protein